MDFKKECPYCHEKVREMIIPYAPDYQMYGYRFWCGCRDNEDDIRYNEHMAYQVYLEERELANFTNFDQYFGKDGRTFKELEEYIDDYCHKHEDLDCLECLFGKAAKNIPSDNEFKCCVDLLEWLDKKRNKE